MAIMENTTPTEPAAEDFNKYASLQNAMDLCAENFNGLPTWVPEGYELEDIIVDETPMQRIYVAIFVNGEKTFRINIRSHLLEESEKIEISNDPLEIYRVSDMEYYIFANANKLRVVWLDGSYECNISGDLTVEEIKKMIDSIVKG